MEALYFSQNIPAYEQIVGFGRKNKKNIQMKYTKKKEGYQVDTLCYRGYTYTFYFFHQSPPTKFIYADLVHSYACITFMFD